MPESIQLAPLSLLRVAAVSPQLGIADVDFNTAEIIRTYSEARDRGAQIVVYPELCITAYSCADLFFEKALLDAAENSLQKLCDVTQQRDGVMIVGLPIRSQGKLYNAAAVISGGIVAGIIPKTHLPNYREFYEQRWFCSSIFSAASTVSVCGNNVPFGTSLLFCHTQSRLSTATSCSFAVELCEDLWAPDSPSTHAAMNGAEIILNLSASNELLSKSEYRRDLVRMQSARCLCSYVYSSAGACESSTDLVYAGHAIIAENGTILGEARNFDFHSSMIISDIDLGQLRNDRQMNSSFRFESTYDDFTRVNVFLGDESVTLLQRSIDPHPFVPNSPEHRSARCKEIFTLQSTALARRMKHLGCSTAVIGLSGGLDSTLALLVAVQAFDKLSLDRRGIHAVTMPGFGTTTRTKGFAEDLATSLGVTFRTIDIHASVRQHFQDIGHNEKIHDIVFENAQARERTQILMDIANSLNGIVIGTGDLSEIALGWNTYSGDHISMYAVNSGVPKSLIRYMVDWCSQETQYQNAGHTLRDILNTPVSPELLPRSDENNNPQETESIIGPYELHDFFLYQMLRFHTPPLKILNFASIAFSNAYDRSTIKKWLQVFYRRFFSNQFKRSCFSDGPKVGSVSLSPRADWRMPSDAQVKLWLDEIS